jgi:succinoglycan biosynthesis protein ExoM
MNNLAICIPTYKRPALLEKLVLSIIESNIDSSLIKKVSIIVVDNDIDSTAEKVISELKERFIDLFIIYYYTYPSKGISNVRNELLRKALSLKPDFIVFIDDDEYVTSQWLNALVRTVIINKADVARGPVLPEIVTRVSKHISCWFINKEDYPDNTLLTSLYTSLYTGNLIIRRSSLEKYDTWFDSRFNITGSGDTFFGVQILKKGARISWSANAIVFERIPENRTTLEWLIKRTYRGASTYMYMLKLERSYFKIGKKIIISSIYIISGLFALILLPLPVRKKYWGILKLSDGIGGFAGIFNLLYLEYK